MRLQLDTGNTTLASESTNAGTGIASAGNVNSNFSINNGGADASGLNGDSIAVSGTSQAWSASFADRSARIGQLTAAVQNGSYHVSSSAISQSILASATA